MNIPHLFKFQCYDDADSNPRYEAVVAEGCEWVLTDGVACRLWDGAFVKVIEGTQQFLGSVLDCDPLTDKDYPNGLYQLVGPGLGEGECAFCRGKGTRVNTRRIESGCPHCHGTGRNSEGFDKPTLVRVGDEQLTGKCADVSIPRETCPNLTFEYLKNAFKYWRFHGILWYHEDDESKPMWERRLAKVERRLFK